VERLGVNVELGKEVTRAVVEQLEPDVLIVATGAVPLIPSMPGVDSKDVVTAEAVLAGEARVGKTVAVAGGGRLGVEMAYHLSQQGTTVTVVEMTGEIGADLELSEKMYFLKALEEAHVRMLTNSKIEAFTEKGVEVVDKEWQREFIPVDTVILALGAESQDALVEELEGLDVQTHIIGDCVEPRTIYEAVHEGAQVARWL
jgi:2-enoate reductase